MAAWTAADFASAAARLAHVLAQDIAPPRPCWSYERGCLVAATTRRRRRPARTPRRDDVAAVVVRARAANGTAAVDEPGDCGLLVEAEDDSLWNDPDAAVAAQDSDCCCCSDDVVMSADTTDWRFSVAYSDVWRAPVLYFTVQYCDDGTPCPRRTVLDMLLLHDSRQKENATATAGTAGWETDLAAEGEEDTSWDFVSHDEHPVTGTPSFFLHPCRTLERLELLQANTGGITPAPTAMMRPSVRLWSWFALILPTVRVFVSPATFVRVQRQLTATILDAEGDHST